MNKLYVQLKDKDCSIELKTKSNHNLNGILLDTHLIGKDENADHAKG